MKRLFLSIVVIGFFSINLAASQVSTGIWKQTSSTAGDCGSCKIQITKPTSHIVQINANNNWIGYAYYNQSTDSYKGAFEWKKGNGGAYENHVFLIELVYEGKTLTMKAKGTKLAFTTTYRKK